MTGNPYIYDGYVVANDDPEGRLRIKVCVPGVLEPESAWALPMATLGGGSKNRGGFLVPDVGAMVGVYGCGGDMDNPRYFCGYWRDGELPEENENGDPHVFALSVGGVRLTLSRGEIDADNPDGRGYARLALTPGDKGTYLELDGGKNSAVLRGITNLFLLAIGQVKLDALIVQFYDKVYNKVVLKTPRPVQ